MWVETDRQSEEENLGSKQNPHMSKSSRNFGVTWGLRQPPGRRLLLTGHILLRQPQGCGLCLSYFSLWHHVQLRSLSEPRLPRLCDGPRHTHLASGTRPTGRPGLGGGEEAFAVRPGSAERAWSPWALGVRVSLNVPSVTTCLHLVLALVHVRLARGGLYYMYPFPYLSGRPRK